MIDYGGVLQGEFVLRSSAPFEILETIGQSLEYWSLSLDAHIALEMASTAFLNLDSFGGISVKLASSENATELNC